MTTTAFAPSTTALLPLPDRRRAFRRRTTTTTTTTTAAVAAALDTIFEHPHDDDGCGDGNDDDSAMMMMTMEIEQILDFAGVDVDGSDFDWGYEAVLRSYNTLETLISYPGRNSYVRCSAILVALHYTISITVTIS